MANKKEESIDSDRIAGKPKSADDYVGLISIRYGLNNDNRTLLYYAISRKRQGAFMA